MQEESLKPMGPLAGPLEVADEYPREVADEYSPEVADEYLGRIENTVEPSLSAWVFGFRSGLYHLDRFPPNHHNLQLTRWSGEANSRSFPISSRIET